MKGSTVQYLVYVVGHARIYDLIYKLDRGLSISTPPSPAKIPD